MALITLKNLHDWCAQGFLLATSRRGLGHDWSNGCADNLAEEIVCLVYILSASNPPTIHLYLSSNSKKQAYVCRHILFFVPYTIFKENPLMGRSNFKCWIEAFILEYILWEKRASWDFVGNLNWEFQRFGSRWFSKIPMDLCVLSHKKGLLIVKFT